MLCREHRQEIRNEKANIVLMFLGDHQSYFLPFFSCALFLIGEGYFEQQQQKKSFKNPLNPFSEPKKVQLRMHSRILMALLGWLSLHGTHGK